MQTYGGSEFGESDFLLFGQKIKELTYNTYLEISLEGDESPGFKESVKEELRKYKLHIKEELLDSYGKKSKFKELNDIVLDAAKSEGYQEVAHSGSDELYDFTGLTEKILKKIGISYVLTEDELDSIRALLGSSGSRAPSRTSSRSSRGSTKRKKKPTKKKKKKKPTKKKKKKKPTKKKRTLKKRRETRGGGGPAKLSDVQRMATADGRGTIIIMTVTSYGDENPLVEAGFEYARGEDGFTMCQVIGVEKGSPAQMAGVKVGHYLLTLNDEDVTKVDLYDLMHHKLKDAKTKWQKTFGVDNVYVFGPPNCLGGHKGCESCKEMVAQAEQRRLKQAENEKKAVEDAFTELGYSGDPSELYDYLNSSELYDYSNSAELDESVDAGEQGEQDDSVDSAQAYAYAAAAAGGETWKRWMRKHYRVHDGRSLTVQELAQELKKKRGGRPHALKKKRGGIRGGGAKLSARYPPERDPFTGNLRVTVTSYSENDTAGFETANSSDETHMCHVASVKEGSPAAQASVRVGDYLLKLNDVDVSKMTLQETISHLKKPKTLSEKWFGVDNVYEFGSDDVRAMNTELCPSTTLDQDLQEDIQDKVRTADKEVLRDMKAYLRTAKPHLQLLEDWLYSKKGSRDTGAPEERVLGETGKWHELWTKAKEEISAEQAEKSGEIAMMGSSSGFGLDDATPAAATALDQSVPVKTSSDPSSRPSSPRKREVSD